MGLILLKNGLLHGKLLLFLSDSLKANMEKASTPIQDNFYLYYRPDR